MKTTEEWNKVINDRETLLREALVLFVRCENNFGHTGQHTDKECVDCLRVRKANAALSRGFLRDCGTISESIVAAIQQDAYQAGLKDGEIKGLERAVEIDMSAMYSPQIRDALPSEIQKRKEGK